MHSPRRCGRIFMSRSRDHLSLPLLTRPEKDRLRLLQAAFNLLLPGSPFVQFTYMNSSPVPLQPTFHATVSRRIWKNLPPARVWTYRRPTV